MGSISFIKEHDDARVSATPKTVAELKKAGFAVLVERHAGHLASIEDDAFTQAGAKFFEKHQAYHADIVVGINAPTHEQIEHLKEGSTWISMIDTLTGKD